MKSFKEVIYFLNPIAHLGETKYSIAFPFFASLVVYIISELLGYFIIKNPNNMGTPDVIITFLLVAYFSFRFAIRGGLVAWVMSTVFFAYFIAFRHASTAEKEQAIITASILAFLYLCIGLIIGWLKQTLDGVIYKEKLARIKAEDQTKYLQTVIDQLPLGVAIAEAPSGRIITTNQQMSKMFNSVAQHAGSIAEYGKVKVVSQGRGMREIDWPLTQSLLEGKLIVGKEAVFKNKKNETMDLLISAAPIRDKDNKIITAVTTISDITKQKELEKRKDDFINIASHELKTPLTSAKVFAQILEKRFSSSGDKYTIGIISKINFQLYKLEELIRNLLDVTRIQKGRLPMEKKKFYIRELAEEIVEDLQPISTHELVLDWHSRHLVCADKDRIRQVLTNLVTNAIKYSPDSKKIIISSQVKKDKLKISVRDFGMGIPKEEQKKIFNRFYQVSEHTTFPGLGLGLYISSEIIKEHGGKMQVISEVGNGSTFSFTLPIEEKS